MDSKNLENLVCDLCSLDSEKEWFEFKTNWFNPVELGEYISALSNSASYVGRKRGFLVWGIDDHSHSILGTDFNPDIDVKGEPLKHFLARQIFPEVNFSFEEILIDGKRIVVLIIPSAKTVPTSFKNERYIRIGSSKELLRKFPEKESYLFEVLRHGLPTIENVASEYQDLTFEKLIMYYGAKGIKLNMETYKKNLGLFTEDGKYNILAQLLSDNSHIPIRVAIFSGLSKSDKLFSIREFGNQCLLYSLDEVLRYGDVLNIMQTDERERVVERKDVPLFDNNAFREAIINAFLHNSWVTKNEPMFTVYSDRIEIVSRGGIAPEQSVDGFFAGISVPVNRRLSEIFLQLHISEKTGRGVPKIISAYGKEAYQFGENTITLTIPFNWLSKNVTQSNQNNDISDIQNLILAEIRHNPNVTKRELQSILKVSKVKIDNNIKKLREAKKIERIGSNKFGYWKAL